LDELGDLGRPVARLHRLRPQAVALADVLVGPHVDDLVQRSDLGVPERGERRDLLAVLVGLAEALLDLGETAHLHAVRADLVDHVPTPFPLRELPALRSAAATGPSILRRSPARSR